MGQHGQVASNLESKYKSSLIGCLQVDLEGNMMSVSSAKTSHVGVIECLFLQQWAFVDVQCDGYCSRGLYGRQNF